MIQSNAPYIHLMCRRVIFFNVLIKVEYWGPAADAPAAIDAWFPQELWLHLPRLAAPRMHAHSHTDVQPVTAALHSLLICLIEVSLHSTLKVTLW